MKSLIFVMSILTSTSLLASTMEFNGVGNARLEGKVKTVQVACKMNGFNKDNFVKVGKEEFDISGNCENINGRMEVKTNGTVTASKNVMVLLNEQLLVQVKNDTKILVAEFGLSLEEAKNIVCKQDSNAVVVVADNLTDNISVNCIVFK